MLIQTCPHIFNSTTTFRKNKSLLCDTSKKTTCQLRERIAATRFKPSYPKQNTKQQPPGINVVCFQDFIADVIMRQFNFCLHKKPRSSLCKNKSIRQSPFKQPPNYPPSTEPESSQEFATGSSTPPSLPRE